VKKLSLLKFVNKMDLKFHKRDNGSLFVKFDEIAKAWIERYLMIESMTDKIQFNKGQKLTSFEANKKKSKRLAGNSNM
jgi:predicted flavoprotein YhiN